MAGWVKLHRCLLNNPIVCKDADHLAVWSYLLLSASHNYHDALFGGERITLNPGQLITGRKTISTKLNISESKVQRILKTFEIEHQIEQRTSTRNRLISIVNWDIYQTTEQQTEQQVNNKRTTSEQQVNTTKNIKNIKNIKNVCVREHTHPYGILENVFLTKAERQSLRETYERSEELIDKVSTWLPEHPGIKNHNAICLKFAINDKWPKWPKQNEQKPTVTISEEERQENIKKIKKKLEELG